MGNPGRLFRCLLAGAAIAAAAGFSEPARAEVSVSINIGPPPIVVAEPPAVVMIPHSQVHFVPDPGVEVFFYSGFWWSPRGDRWYRARAYNGPWGVIDRRRVPRAVLYVPPDYRARYERERHVPYGQWKKERPQWDQKNRKSQKNWEKEREREWKESEKKNRKDEKHGDHGGGGGGDHGKHGR